MNGLLKHELAKKVSEEEIQEGSELWDELQ